MNSRRAFKIRLFLSVFLGMTMNQVWSQTLDSARVQTADSVAIRVFLTDTGPAEAVFPFISPSPYRFKSGVYTISNPDFPLLYSPDSLVQQPVELAHKQRRIVRISTIATAVPLAVLIYSATRILFALGAVATGRPTTLGLPSGDVIRVSGITAVAGIAITGTFNIASTINLHKGIKRHNRLFGRKAPGPFNPRGL